MSEIEIVISGELDLEVADRFEEFLQELTGEKIEQLLNMLTQKQSRALQRVLNAGLRRVQERRKIVKEDYGS